MSLFQELEQHIYILKGIQFEILSKERDIAENYSDLPPSNSLLSEAQVLQSKQDNDSRIMERNQLKDKILNLENQFNNELNTAISKISVENSWLAVNEWLQVCKQGNSLETFAGNKSLFDPWKKGQRIDGIQNLEIKHKVYKPY